jgi:acyl-CoA reductase-like NAD-dependent aldehyde dehydrogenase
MLIDGKLVDTDSGSTFDNVNPATEEVLGTVADASAAEMQRAIDAARRAFDNTDWSTNRASASSASRSCRPRSRPTRRPSGPSSSPRSAVP